MMDIGRRIALLRKKAGLTQEQLADALGTTRQAVSKWESGKSLPDIDYAIGLGRQFGVSMDHLLLGKEEPAKPAEPAPAAAAAPADRFRLRLVLAVVLVGSVVVLLLLPLGASLYAAYMHALGPVYTDPRLYLREWPLCGVRYLAWAGVLGALSGLLWLWYQGLQK